MPSNESAPRPRYIRPHGPGVAASTATKNGHHPPYRLRMAEPAPSSDVGVVRSYTELLVWCGLWLLLRLSQAALLALLMLGVAWAGQHAFGWLITLATGGRQ